MVTGRNFANTSTLKCGFVTGADATYEYNVGHDDVPATPTAQGRHGNSGGVGSGTNESAASENFGSFGAYGTRNTYTEVRTDYNGDHVGDDMLTPFDLDDATDPSGVLTALESAVLAHANLRTIVTTPATFVSATTVTCTTPRALHATAYDGASQAGLLYRVVILRSYSNFINHYDTTKIEVSLPTCTSIFPLETNRQRSLSIILSYSLPTLFPGL